MNSKLNKDNSSSTLPDKSESVDEAVSKTRREFIKKYGALAAITPVALTLTMHSRKALAASVCTECGPSV